MHLLITAGIVRSDLYLLLWCLAFFENTVRLCFLNWSSTYLLLFQYKLVVVWAEGWSAKWRDNLLSKGSAGWKDKNINTKVCFYLSHSSMLCELLASKELKVFVSQEIGRNLCAQVKLKGRMCDSYLLTDGMSIT